MMIPEALMGSDELDQFERLEQRVESLISLVIALREENATLGRQVQDDGERVRSLEKEMEVLRTERETVRERITALLRKVEECA
jgi:FtsZ-binding cell division protein ZapB